MPVSIDLSSEKIGSIISISFGALISLLEMLGGRYDVTMLVVAFSLVTTIPLFLLMWEYRAVARSVMNILRPVFVHRFKITASSSVESATLDGKLGPTFWVDTKSFKTFTVSYISKTTGKEISSPGTGRIVSKLVTVSRGEQVVVRVTNPCARTITVDLRVYGNAPPREDSANLL